MDIQNPEKIEIEGLKTIHKLCKFGAEYNMEGCSFTEIVERMFDELNAKAQAVPGWVSVEDKLPIDGQDVIAFDAIKHCVFKGGEFLQGYIESDTGHEYEEPVEVTHWMAVEAQEQNHV